jgi:hypothetical protein
MMYCHELTNTSLGDTLESNSIIRETSSKVDMSNARNIGIIDPE